MAILRQQAHFIEQLYDSGMVDEAEVRRLGGISLPGLQTLDAAYRAGTPGRPSTQGS